MNIWCALWGHRVYREPVWRRVPQEMTPIGFLTDSYSEGFWEHAAYLLSEGPTAFFEDYRAARCEIGRIECEVRCERCRATLETVSEAQAFGIQYEVSRTGPITFWTVGPLRRFLRTYRCLLFGHYDVWEADIALAVTRRKCFYCGDDSGEIIAKRQAREMNLSRAELEEIGFA